MNIKKILNEEIEAIKITNFIRCLLLYISNHDSELLNDYLLNNDVPFQFKKLEVYWIENNKIYRGLNEHNIKNNKFIFESWTTDEETAEAFAGKNGKVIEKNIDEVKVLISVDASIDLIESNFMHLLDDEMIDYFNGIYSESEVIIRKNN